MGRKFWGYASISAVVLLGLIFWLLDVPHWQKLDLNKLRAQPISTIVYDTYGEAINTSSYAQSRDWIPLSGIPEHVRNAFIAAEDQRFYVHCGISIPRIFGALINNLQTGSYSQGASTITQQLIKLTHLSGEKTLSRKAQEAVLAIQLEKKMSKNQILESYLNTIYFGKGAYGVGSAAQIYFAKDVSSLTVAEAALLAGVIKAPSTYAPHLNPEKSVERRNFVLNEMHQCGFINDDQYAISLNEPLVLSTKSDSSDQYGWFLDAVLEEASELLEMNVGSVLSSGLSIHTSFDAFVQDAANALFLDESNFPVSADDGTPVQAALVAMRPQTGEICALIGGRDYKVQRGLNRATQIRRSPGSAIKPVSVYAAAIDAYDFTPTSMIEDTPREFVGGYTPGNAGGKYYGTVTLREALSRSLNIATVDLADLIGLSIVKRYAGRFGLDLSPQDSNLALALGSLTHGISPAQLCGAYAALANGGIRVTPHLISRIDNRDGQTIYRSEPSDIRAVEASTAYMITDMLRTAASTGSAKALSSTGLPIAGKTGTVSDPDGSSRDIWTAAYTPELVLTVWMGYDTPDELHFLPSSEGGSGYPARLCASLLDRCRSALRGDDFEKPDSVRTALLDGLALQNDEVLLATEHTPAEYVVHELFLKNNLPEDHSLNWTSPRQITDLTLLSDRGETPVLQFTVQDDRAEYLVLRTTEDGTETATELTGSKGEILRFSDEGADLSQCITYTVLPRHRLLYERGTLLTGKESAAVTYSPGSVMDILFGSDSGQSTPEPTEIEFSENQSMFG